ncbi:MAG: LLM class flavin-dependent oxidoreductase [Cumulibacter sp.]
MSRLKFGAFLAPIHDPGINPTLALEQDLELMVHLDRLGFDEAWIGEHHSAGSEIIASPEIFIAAAAERTKHIRFGTGVTSVSYHNPLWVAERMIQLDHQTRGRVILGLGPGSLPSDSAMIGLTPTDTRELLGENVEILARLLRGESVTKQTKTHNLVNAHVHLRPYSDQLEMVVAAMVSPTGPRLAGTHGLGMISVGATLTQDGFDALAHHWNVVEERAAAHNQTVSRDAWRLVGVFHLAETEEQARKDVRLGIKHWFNYFQQIAAFPQQGIGTESEVDDMVDTILASTSSVIGTPEQARAQIEALQKQSGGFGTLLLNATDWADRAATFKSYELFAREVMPHFQGQAQATTEAAERAAALRDVGTQGQLDAIAHMQAKYDAELAAAKAAKGE